MMKSTITVTPRAPNRPMKPARVMSCAQVRCRGARGFMGKPLAIKVKRGLAKAEPEFCLFMGTMDIAGLSSEEPLRLLEEI